MENVLTTGIDIILWMQGLGNWLTPIMKFFTFLGNQEFYLIVAPIILWCIDSTLGFRLGLFLMVSGLLNSALKIAFHEPRPYWLSKNVFALGNPENSFGVPSGHAQNSVVVWGTLAASIKKAWFWVVAIFVIFMIGISRLYLAVHFPQDVLLGWVFGTVILWLLLKLERPVVKWIKNYSSSIQILIAFLFSMILIMIIMVARYRLVHWNLPDIWILNAHIAFPDEPTINPLSFHNFLSNAGAFFGMAAGWIWMNSQGGFSTKAEWWKLVSRYIVGVVGVMILYIGLGSLFPDTETSIAYILRYVRYALIGFWMAGFAPWLFVKLKLASRL